MEAQDNKIPDTTLDTLTRNFFKETLEYGFGQTDYVRFVNRLLDYAMGSKQSNQTADQRIDESTADIRSTCRDARYASLPLVGERIKIRAFDSSRDRSVLKQWLEDEQGRYFLLSHINASLLRVEKLVEDDANILGMMTGLDDTPIGVMAYLHYGATQGKAELRKLVGEATMRGKGLGREATRLWIRYGFDGLNLNKIYLNTFDTNIRNIRLNEELGFRVEGILRNEIFVDGKYRDVLRMGLWREDRGIQPKLG